MTSPVGAAKAAAGTSAGAVYVDVLPNTKRFASNFRARMRALSRGERIVVPVDLDVEESIKDTTKRLRDSKGKFRKAGEEIGKEVTRGTDRGFRAFFLSSSWKKRGDNAVKSFGQSFGRSMKESAIGAVSMLPSLLKPTLIVVGVAIAATLAPLIAGAIASGILLALGGGILAIGIASAIDNPKVEKAFGKLAKRGKKIFDDFGKAFEKPLIRAARTFDKALKDSRPAIMRISKALAPVIDKLAPALAKMATNMLPGIEKALKDMQPLWDVLAEMLPELGTALGDFFATLAKDGPALAVILKDILKGIIWFIGFLGDEISRLVGKYMIVRKATIATVNWIKKAWKEIVDWWKNTIVPSWNKAVDDVVGFFHGLGDSINRVKDDFRGAWNGVKNWWTNDIVPSFNRTIDRMRGYFKAFGDFFTESIPRYFRTAVEGAQRWWRTLAEKVSKPIYAVVNFVNGGLIGAWNWIVDKLGFGKKIPPFNYVAPAFAQGGTIPGRVGATRRDNMLANVQSGEYVMPVDKTKAYLPILEAMRRGKGIPGFADGGLVGLITNPVGTIGSKVGGAFNDMSNAFGPGGAGDIVRDFGEAGKKGLIAKAKAILTTLMGGESMPGLGSAVGRFFAGGAGYGGLTPKMLVAAMELKKLFGMGLVSGFRAGSRTLSGNLSYHALGRAGDFAPILQAAMYLRQRWGSQIKELITPWNMLNMLNGRPHFFSGEVFDQHAGTGRFKGNAHIHLALADGGLVGQDYSRMTGLRSDAHWNNIDSGKGPHNQIENININYPPDVSSEEALMRTMQKLELLHG